MIKINNATGRKLTGMVAAVAFAALVGGCAKQESVITAPTDTHAQAIAQTDIPEVIVTASRDSATTSATTRHE
jgi:hypothetical protein